MRDAGRPASPAHKDLAAQHGTTQQLAAGGAITAQMACIGGLECLAGRAKRAPFGAGNNTTLAHDALRGAGTR